MRAEPLDFIGVDYAVDNRTAAETILPLAEERGIGVLVYVPFGRTRLFRRVGDRPVPDWAKEIGIASWAQFFLKFAAAHPAVTVVTPATSDAEHMLDNMGAAYGELPDAALQQRMAEFIDALPEA
jgi:aryl-alcohol dehydrogenase-like predicted oxidoreductase